MTVVTLETTAEFIALQIARQAEKLTRVEWSYFVTRVCAELKAIEAEWDREEALRCVEQGRVGHGA